MSNRNDFYPFLNLDKLTQQYIVDAWVKVDMFKVIFHKKKSKILRTALYKGLMDHLKKKKLKKMKITLGIAKLEKCLVLPSSFMGSPRVLH